MSPRSSWFALALVVLALTSALAWSLYNSVLPPADMVFVNGTEIQSIDPAIVEGSPEGRVVRGLFEGLCDWHPETVDAIPAVAERWEISPDGKLYTFHLRPTARWSDGSPVTAFDFEYSLRRFLDPLTGSVYTSLFKEVKNAARYNEVRFEVGEPVEVELEKAPRGASPFARGEVLRGKLLAVEELPTGEGKVARAYLVEIAGKRRRFTADARALARHALQAPSAAPAPPTLEGCKQVLLDFSQVGVKALDERTLRVELVNAVPYFLQIVGFYPVYPVQRKCVETHGYPGWTRPENLVTNGPYTLGMRRVRDRVRMVKNPHYWDRDNVKLNVVDALAVESDVTAFNMYLNGQVDWVTTVPAPVIPSLLAAKRPDFPAGPQLATYFYRINTTRPPLNDPRVRLALALTLPKEKVVRGVTKAGEQPTDWLTPPGMGGYDAVKAEHAEEMRRIAGHDVARARALLAEAGFPGGEGLRPIELLYNKNETHEAIAELLQSEWKEALGVRVRLQNKEWSSYLTDQNKLNYDICRAGWTGDYKDPSTFLELFTTAGQQNNTGWSNAEYDALVAEAARTPLYPDWEAGQRKRFELFARAELVLAGESPVIPTYSYVSKEMARTYLKGFYHNALDVHPFKGMWIDPAEKARALREERWGQSRE